MANTFGYGGMTNHLGDMMFSKYILIIGANPAVNHPVSMVHILRAKENGAKLVCIDPRFTKTAAKCDEFHRIRSGTDIAFAYGLLNHIIAKKLYDEQYLKDRVDGYEMISLTHYSDGVLADDDDEKMADDEVDEVVGADYAEHFGEYEDDSVFIRNDKLKCDYEILLDQRKYSELHNITYHKGFPD